MELDQRIRADIPNDSSANTVLRRNCRICRRPQSELLTGRTAITLPEHHCRRSLIVDFYSVDQRIGSAVEQAGVLLPLDRGGADLEAERTDASRRTLGEPAHRENRPRCDRCGE